MARTVEQFVEEWHRAVRAKDAEAMEALLCDEVVFRSPVFWAPHRGKDYTAQILKIMVELFDTFEYLETYRCGNNLCFHFEATTMGKGVRGVDLIGLDDNGQIESFEVMIRPLNGLMALGEKVRAMFEGK